MFFFRDDVLTWTRRLRGLGGNIICIDEFYYTNQAQYDDVVVPMMGKDETMVIAISTLGEKPQSWTDRVLDSGVFQKEIITYCCKPCYDRGVRDICVHNIDNVPHYMSVDNLRSVKKMLGPQYEANFMRESVGIVDKTTNHTFDPSQISALRSRPKAPIRDYVRYIYLSIDPVTGSRNCDTRTSDFAVVAICEPYTTILGMEALDVVRKEDYERTLCDFVERIRDDDYLRAARIILDVEAGTGLEAPNINSLLTRTFHHIIPLREMGNRKEGTVTTNERKLEMVQLTRAELDVGAVRVWDKFVTSNKGPVASVLEEFFKQFGEFQQYEKLATEPFQRNQYVFSGKGANNKGRDDLIMTFLRCVYARKAFKYENRYAHLRE